MITVILDVDGVIVVPELPLIDTFDSKATVDRKIINNGRTFIVEETIRWHSRVKNFLQTLNHNSSVEIVWLTGWKNNAIHVFDELFDIKSNGFIDWDMNSTDVEEKNKWLAVKKFVTTNNVSQFVWVDDIATKNFTQLPEIDSCVVQTHSDFGLTVEHIANIQKFVAEN